MTRASGYITKSDVIGLDVPQFCITQTLPGQAVDLQVTRCSEQQGREDPLG